jgi:23S rRNA (adenine2030-N6)-methyltransferase
MLAYRHQFHAGNFADVFKHALLTRLLILLGRKEKPYLYLDTHAGSGRYDLHHPWATKNAEHEDGIGRLWKRNDVPALLIPYMDTVRAENRGPALRFYPGSPLIARRLLRAEDRMVLIELNRDDCKTLMQLLEGDRRAQVHLEDGYHALKAFLPPLERRGIVLIDSSFDRSGEFARLTEGLAVGYRRWATGVFALWYPLMEPAVMHGFERGLIDTGIRKILQLELSVLPDGWSASLRGCGMLVVNPPFGLDEEAQSILKWLWPILSEAGEGATRLRWLVPE